jgi:Flp pilus assembly pilin Flp
MGARGGWAPARAITAALEGERGHGTVEYVRLILLVSLLIVGMVAAMKGFNDPRI